MIKKWLSFIVLWGLVLCQATSPHNRFSNEAVRSTSDIFESQTLALGEIFTRSSLDVPKTIEMNRSLGKTALHAEESRSVESAKEILFMLSKDTSNDPNFFVSALQSFVAGLAGVHHSFMQNIPESLLPMVGQRIDAIATNRADAKMLGHITPYVMLVLDIYTRNHEQFVTAERRLRCLVEGVNTESRLMALFTEGIMISRHLRSNGAHLLTANTLVDNNALASVVAEYLPLLIEAQANSTLWNKRMLVMPSHENVRIRFGDFIIWGLAEMMDLRLHDPRITFEMRAAEEEARLFGPSENVIVWYATHMLSGVRAMPPHVISALLTQMFKSDQEWEALGFRPPAQDGDLTPRDFSGEFRSAMQDPERPMRDVILNFALKRSLYSAIKSAVPHRQYMRQYGPAADFLRKVFREWEPFRSVAFLQSA
jgi:hypothetical protein